MSQIDEKIKPLSGLPYRFRYMNGSVSQGGFKTFESAAKNFFDCKKCGGIYNDLKDVICIEERKRDYLKGV